MDEVTKRRKAYGCRKCGSMEVRLGVTYQLPGDYPACLCDECREQFSAEAPLLEWHQEWLAAVAQYEAAAIRFYGRTDVSEADVAAALGTAREAVMVAGRAARKHSMAWLDKAEPVAKTA